MPPAISSPVFMPRLFIGYPVPDRLHPPLSAVRTDLTGARWTTPVTYHVTVAYFGPVTATQTERLAAAVETLSIPSVSLNVQGLGTFGSPDAPRVLFAHLPRTPRLDLVHQRAHSLFPLVDASPDPRPYRPHVTLARFRHADPSHVHHLLTTHRDLHLGWQADTLYLYDMEGRSNSEPYHTVATAEALSASS